jgi:hypothetical protein
MSRLQLDGSGSDGDGGGGGDGCYGGCGGYGDE